MTTTVRRSLRIGALISLLLGLALPGPACFAQQRVGVDSAVNPAAMGIPPGGSPRRLVLGQDVVFNERITTEAEGQTQILFVDESTLSVGPNANMVIDRFVYDPNAGTGQLAASLTRGVFRFVGGKLSKQDNAVVMRTPAATIGIRGGVMLVRVGADCAPAAALPAAGCSALQVIFVYGKGVTITGLNGVSQTITRPGFEVTVARPGASPSDPGPAPPGATAGLLAQVDGRAGGNGGAPAVPTEVMVIDSGIANTVSANVAASIEASARTQPPAPQPQNVGPVVQQNQLNYQNVSVPGATVTPITGGAARTIADLPTLPAGTPIGSTSTSTSIGSASTSIGSAGTSASTSTGGITGGGTGGGGGVLPPSSIHIVNATGNVFSNGSLVPYTAGNVSNGVFTATTTTGPVSFALTASSEYASADSTFFYATATTGAFVYGGQPVNVSFYNATSSSPTVLAFQLPAASVIPFLSAQTAAGLAAGSQNSVSPLILATPTGSVFSTSSGSTKALQASLAINGTGAGQSSAIVVLVGNVFGSPPVLEGVIHGSYLASATGQPTRINSYYATPVDGMNNSFYGNAGISGFVLSPGAGAASAVETNTLNQTTTNTYQFAQPAVPTTAPTVATATPTAQTMTGWFGGIMTKEPNGGAGSPIPYMLAGHATISTYPSDLHITAALTGGDPATSRTSGIPAANGMVLQFGSTDGTNARQAYINNNLFAVEESPSTQSTVNGVSVPLASSFPNTNPNLYLVTQTAAAPTSLLPNGLCSACQYLQWGYWGGEIDTPASGANAARIDVGHINSWVAGIPTGLSDISSLKAANFTGSYAGNLFGTVVNNGAQYLASGGLSAVYHFGTQQGTFSVINYDAGGVSPAGLSFTSSGSAPLLGSNYAFAFKTPGVTGAVSGSFYGPMAAETGGNFAFSKTVGSPYFTSGIFAAKR